MVKVDENLVDILLSLYNGERYLEPLLDSLLKQTYQNWKLIVRDDGSTDSSLGIIRNYIKRYPNKIVLIEDNKKLGPSQSFAELLNYSNAQYIMFCDQDDIWLPKKIELTLNKMYELESVYKNTPLLVHTDLKVVDEKLRIIDQSFFKFQHLNPELQDLNSLLIQNNVTGCTVMINAELKKLSMPIPKEAIMHDWWVALVASSFGKIGYINTPTILYRQHSNNNIGARKYSFKYFFSRIGKLEDSIQSNRKIIKQSKLFVDLYRDKLSKQQYSLVYNFSTICNKGRLKRIHTLLKYKYRKYGKLRNIGFFVVLILAKKEKER
ncbi:glycosyltransferase family 2 protein [Geobacillus sp. Geo 8.1]